MLVYNALVPTCDHPWCHQPFEILPEDREFLKKFDCPEPRFCPNCRHQFRGMFRPGLRFYRRKSDLSRKPILSIYSATQPFPVYANDEWWSDVWDGLTFGRSFDFSCPFFSQFFALHALVPKMATPNEHAENCEYCNGAGNARNSYYSTVVHRSEDVYYSERVTGYCSDVIDSLRCQKSSQLFECIQCVGCHISSFLFFCSDTRDSHYCIDCQGCHDCLFSHNLRNGSYMVHNQKVSPEEFRRIKEETLNGRFSTLQKNLVQLQTVWNETLWKNLNNVNAEDCTGDGLVNCACCHQCFGSFNAVDVRYSWDLTPSEKCVSSMDITQGGIGELLYNGFAVGGVNYFLRMCIYCRLSSNLTYCSACYSCKDCFGCTGLRSKQYCVLNRQYSKEEYDSLVSRIIGHMRSTNEWGDFFPESLAPCAYNQSDSFVRFPLEKEEVLRRGWKWSDEAEEVPNVTKIIPADKLPDSIDDIPDDVLEWAISCRVSGRPFRIIKKELEYYRSMRLPLPRTHPDLRMQKRRDRLNPYKLWKRNCLKCRKEMETSFSPERKEKVVCEECYLKAVY